MNREKLSSRRTFDATAEAPLDRATCQSVRRTEDNHPLCTCDLEMFFSVCDDRDFKTTLPWTVIDAECEEIAHCKEERHANLIAWVLNATKGNTICPVHGEGA